MTKTDWRSDPATEKQIAAIDRKIGCKVSEPLTKGTASGYLAELKRASDRIEDGPLGGIEDDFLCEEYDRIRRRIRGLLAPNVGAEKS